MSLTAEQQELWTKLEAYSLDEVDVQFPISARLARENNWSIKYTNRVIEEYKKFVFLAMVAGHPVTPSDEVDQVWHLHLIYTRSYWEDFCQNILPQPLHHGPTKGGREESKKYHSWYNNTLESYKKFFGSVPPDDIWPKADIRFGSQFKRVNTKTNIVLSKNLIKRSMFVFILLLFVPTIVGAKVDWEFVRETFANANWGMIFLTLVIVIIGLSFVNRSDKGGDAGGGGGCGGCGGG